MKYESDKHNLGLIIGSFAGLFQKYFEMSINYNEQIVGTCGNCGGPVVMPTIWHSILKPPRICKNCGVHATEDYGPVLPMEKPKYTPLNYKITTDSHS